MVWLAGVGALLLLRARRHRLRLPLRACSSEHETRAAGLGRRSRFRNNEAPPIYCTANDYKAVLAQVLQKGDVALEIGCQLNSVTHLLNERCCAVIGIDIERKAPSTGRMRRDAYYRETSEARAAGLEQVELHIMEVWELSALTEVPGCHDRAVSICCIDASVILGNDLPFEIMSLIRCLSGLLSPRAFVVKSKGLSSLQHALRPAPSRRWPPSIRGGAGGGRPDGRGRAGASVVHIVAAELVHHYRNASIGALSMLDEGECALEIGAHSGTTTVELHKRLACSGGQCVGVDIGTAIIDRARALHPSVCFEVADAWDVGSLKQALDRCGCAPPSLLLIDVGGLSGANGALDALALVRSLSAAFQSSLRVVVIKSSCMKTLAMQLRSAYEVLPPRTATEEAKREAKRGQA